MNSLVSFLSCSRKNVLMISMGTGKSSKMVVVVLNLTEGNMDILGLYRGLYVNSRWIDF